MQTVEEKIQQAMSRGVVLFDDQGELYQMNTVAEKLLRQEDCNRELVAELTNTVRMMSSISRERACVKKMRSGVHGCEIICTVKRVFGDRYRVILSLSSGQSMAIA